ncbi:hypothetical protein D3C78_1317720 [compost metagenome]
MSRRFPSNITLDILSVTPSWVIARLELADCPEVSALTVEGNPLPVTAITNVTANAAPANFFLNSGFIEFNGLAPVLFFMKRKRELSPGHY